MLTNNNDFVNAIRAFTKKRKDRDYETQRWEKIRYYNWTPDYRLFVYENKETLERLTVSNFRLEEESFLVKPTDWKIPEKGRFPEVILPECRSCFCFCVEKIEGIKQDRVYFYCGPQTRSGYVDDSELGLADRTLKQLFPKISLELNLAENFHSLALTEEGYNATVEQLKNKLIEAGAKEIV